MSKEQEVFDIADKVVKRVAKLVAKLDMQNAASVSFDTESSSLVVTTALDGNLITIALHATNRVLRAVTSAMKHGAPITASDMEIYTTEFCNIMCGNLLTVVNDSFNVTAGFAIPHFMKNEYIDETAPQRTKKELFYESGYGPVALQLFYKSPLFKADKTSASKKGDLHMKKKILVVDDSIFIYQEISHLLKDTDFEICAYAKSGEEAIELYKKYSPDIVTMDIILPGMDGIETTKEIMSLWPDAKIIMVSSLAYQQTFEETTALGAHDFIFKPFDRARLLSALLSAVDDN
ncbi:MAG: response regulator [Hydrogenoanaerobacterium sp.]